MFDQYKETAETTARRTTSELKKGLGERAVDATAEYFPEQYAERQRRRDRNLAVAAFSAGMVVGTYLSRRLS